MTTREKSELILEDIMKETSTDPSLIFLHLAGKEYVSLHGPEHHFLDGASLLTAYRNAGGEIDLPVSLERLMEEALKMPGAMCGHWGICGAITSLGAALAILDHTGPLTTDGSWGRHMAFTSRTVGELGAINGPRCCKRDSMVSFAEAVAYVNENYPVKLEYQGMKCSFSHLNKECIKERCPFFQG